MPIIASLLIFIAYYLLAIKKKQSPFYAVPIILIFTFLFAGYIVADSLTGDGINEAVKFQLMTSWTGTGYGEFIPQLAGALIYIVSTAFIVSVSIKVSKLNHVPLATLLGIFAISLNPGAHDLYEWVRPYTYFDEIKNITIEDIQNKNLKIIPPLKKKSFIYIYAESFERSFFDESIFPNLITELKKKDIPFIDFTNIHQVYGTSATMTGMIASQCGIFPTTNIKQEFMPGINCISDILSQHGYIMELIQGGDLSFASTKKFYNTHKFSRLIGKEYFQKKYKGINNFSQWGAYDEYVLAEAKKRFEELSNQKKPFGLFVTTLDTHYPHGHESNSCKLKYANGKNPYLNAIKCADYNLSKLITQISSLPNVEDTIIILASDHLALKNDASHLLKKMKRRNLLRFYNVGSSQSISKAGSTLDNGSTLLHLLGFNVNLGLGTNLLSDEKTLVERYGDRTDNFLRSLTPKIEEASFRNSK